ncbi:hypothetical protein IQ06DRAFT_302383 [Phaeosphaeriaceae sp. SRC1lsM3a]|nr:hypothetical protein IQ06DRAFT_302383 [Stagonospora sp. SRC1lsM3a]
MTVTSEEARSEEHKVSKPFIMSRNNPCGPASPSPDFFACETECSMVPTAFPCSCRAAIPSSDMEIMRTGSVHGCRGRRVDVGNAKVATVQVPIGTFARPPENGSDTVFARLSGRVVFLLCSAHFITSSTRAQTFLRDRGKSPSVPLDVQRRARWGEDQQFIQVLLAMVLQGGPPV